MRTKIKFRPGDAGVYFLLSSWKQRVHIKRHKVIEVQSILLCIVYVFYMYYQPYNVLLQCNKPDWLVGWLVLLIFWV